MSQPNRDIAADIAAFALIAAVFLMLFGGIAAHVFYREAALWFYVPAIICVAVMGISMFFWKGPQEKESNE